MWIKNVQEKVKEKQEEDKKAVKIFDLENQKKAVMNLLSYTPPAGLFTRGPAAIAEQLKIDSEDLKQAMSRLNFYINRAGDNLSEDRAKALEKAKDILRHMYASNKNSFNQDFNDEAEFSFRDQISKKMSATFPGFKFEVEKNHDFIISYKNETITCEWEHKRDWGESDVPIIKILPYKRNDAKDKDLTKMEFDFIFDDKIVSDKVTPEALVNFKKLLETMKTKTSAQRPPKEWWDETTKDLAKKNPSYNEKKVDETAGSIWYHKMDEPTRQQMRRRYQAKKVVSAMFVDNLLDRIKGLRVELNANKLKDKKKGVDKVYPFKSKETVDLENEIIKIQKTIEAEKQKMEEAAKFYLPERGMSLNKK